MNRFVVYPHAHAGWELARAGEQDALRFADKAACVAYARDLAAANRPSALRVETAYGDIEQGWILEQAGSARPLMRR